jgi:hypothetical protein
MMGAEGRWVMAWVLGILFGVIATVQAEAQIAGRSSADAARALSQQVWALQTLHDLDLNAQQLDALRTAAPKLDDDPVARAPGRVSAKYLATLQALRQALLGNKDDDDKDGIDSLRDDLESIQEDEQIDLDDHVRIADAARSAVPGVMKVIQPSQIAGYLAIYQDEVPDPVQSLVKAADDSRGLDEGKYGSLVAETVKEAGIMVAGLDADKAAAVADRVKQWLADNRALGDAEYKAARPQLEQSAKAVLGDLDSFEVLRHWIERDVAELLSNPQLAAVIDERMKHLGK